MNTNLITICESETILKLTSENRKLFEMLEDFALRNNSVMRPVIENGEKVIKAANYVGIVKLNDGTVIEILPKLAGKKAGSFSEPKKLVYQMLSTLLGIPYNDRDTVDMNETFLEYFISVFARECMKIIKSGLLSGYVSVEENMTAVQGNILFAENIRKNLVHRERLYVRHDVFSPDRAENRLIKSTASLMMKLSKSHRSSQNLKQILAYLDDVKFSADYDVDFSKCVNTRNAKKYSIVLNICRLFLKNHNFSEYHGKYVAYAMLFPMEDVFKSYIAGLIKKNVHKTVKTQINGEYLFSKPEMFTLRPDIVIYDEGKPSCIVDTRWQIIEKKNDISADDMCRLYAYAQKFNCSEIVMIYPESSEKLTELPECYCVDSDEKIHIHIRFAQLYGNDKSVISP